MAIIISERLEENFDTIYEAYIEELVEQWYARHVAENCDDWWDEFVLHYYNQSVW